MMKTNIQRTLRKLSIKTFKERSPLTFSERFCASRDVTDQTFIGDLDAYMLDEKVHAEEIRKCAKDLKNNKAARIDNILTDYINPH